MTGIQETDQWEPGSKHLNVGDILLNVSVAYLKQ